MKYHVVRVCRRSGISGSMTFVWIVFRRVQLTICEVPREGDGSSAAEHPPDLIERERGRRRINAEQIKSYANVSENILCLCWALGSLASCKKRTDSEYCTFTANYR